jgi:hypothetical protein
MRPKVLRYRGQCTFHILPDTDIPERFITHREEARLDLKKANRGYERVLQFMYSGQMMDHIIKTYNLYQHYGIDSTRPYAREEAITILNGRTEVYKINNEIMRVSVYDRNNEIAAAIANSMVIYLDLMNKQYVRNSLGKELAINKSILIQSEKITSEQQQKLESALRELESISAKAHPTPESKLAFENMEYVIRDAATTIKLVTDERISTLGLYQKALEQARPGKMNTVVIIKKAVPEMESNKLNLAIYAAFGGLAGVVLVFGALYFFEAYKPQLTLMFGK